MTCTYCGSRNSNGEHRCRRCGRRPGDTLTGRALLPVNGALAAQMRPVPDAEELTGGPDLSRAIQGKLFHDRDSNVIPIETYAPPRPKTRTASKNPARPRAPKVAEGQGSLDFLPPAPAKQRTLGTTVEALIYCEAPVASTLHRAVAAALDWSMVLIGYGVFLLALRLIGGPIPWTKTNVLMLAAMLPVIGATYGLAWLIAGTESAGMQWTQLSLTTFDGFPPDRRQRVLRFAGSCLSICTVVGLLWSLADEESLTWQDHISRTFPTPLALESRVFRRR